jgi:hypothetical protein
VRDPTGTKTHPASCSPVASGFETREKRQNVKGLKNKMKARDTVTTGWRLAAFSRTASNPSMSAVS